MNVKWYYCALVVVLVLLGICNGNIASPNQEIVLQYNTDEVTTEESDNTIAILKEQLQQLGIDNIHVNKASDGELRISYHSSLPIESLKKVLSEKENLGLDVALNDLDKKDSKTPFEDHQKSYKLAIYELQYPSNTDNSAGKYLVIVKQDYDRFFSSNPYPTLNQYDFKGLDCIEKPSHKFKKELAIAKNKTSYCIPEVRAGPIA